MVLSPSFSDLLGYTSIACWLGAQFPQVLENARRQSVDGLALPFLMNWLLGDATNLLGCILTNQLPFQTYLATYFVFVDCSLLGQFYYYRKPPTKALRAPYLHSRERTTSVTTRRLSLDRTASAPHYRALSTVAANVAAAAALAAQQEERARWHNGRSHSTEPHPTAYEDEEEVSEDALARLADSFHSEGGRSGFRKHVAWGRDSYQGRSRHSTVSPSGHMHSSLHMSAPPLPADEVDVTGRGRPLVRAADLANEEDEEWLSANAHRRSSRASRKGATMVFLGVWALFSVGALASSKTPSSSGAIERIGRVLVRAEVPVPTPPANTAESSLADSILSAQLTGEPATFQYLHTADDISTLNDPPPPGPTTEHIIGRISAWICTTLYLTSRLPQIWKNYARKSVEGLSIYLFIFAFLGNFFYVASILTSPNLELPQPEATAFIRESIPYLLGSGGTLMFDVTIVAQSLLYRPKPHARGRRASRSYSEEEAGLLDAGASGAEGSPVTSRRRAGSVNGDVTAL